MTNKPLQPIKPPVEPLRFADLVGTVLLAITAAAVIVSLLAYFLS